MICDAVRAGAFLAEAAEHAGVGRSTVYRWLERAESDAADAQPFRDFRDALTRARASAEVGAVAIVRKHMRDDWRAAAFYLERAHPERWRRREVHEHTGEDGGPITLDGHGRLDLGQLTDEELDQLAAINAKLAARDE